MLRKLFARKPLSRVHLNGGAAEFEVGRNMTILESALAAGIAYPHDCTVGTCGSCRTRLITGAVEAITPFGYTLSKEELEGGYILACQAVPKGDVEIVAELGALPAVQTRGRIIAVEDMTHDIRRVEWHCDVPIAYLAGQYMSVRWPGGSGSRNYSFSTAPSEGGSTRLETFVRKVPGGAFTEQLFGAGFDGIEFEVEGPLGNFWLRDGDGPILLIGGGSGLAPLMSVLEDGLAKGIKRDAILLFGARQQRDLYCADKLARITDGWVGSFDYWPILSETPVDGLRSGFVTAAIDEAVAQLGGTTKLQAYLCGPPAMIDAGVASLTESGLPLDRIHYDKFTDASTGTA